MESEKSFLTLLVGKTVTKTDIATSTIVALKSGQGKALNERISITIQLFFEDYLLNIYNPVKINPEDKNIFDFIGQKVISVDEAKESTKLIFDSGFDITVKMTESDYYDPEAMSLHGPNNFCAVWN